MLLAVVLLGLGGVWGGVAVASTTGGGGDPIDPGRRGAMGESTRGGERPRCSWVRWSSTNPGIAGVSPQGMVTSSSRGVTIVVARSGNTISIPALVLVL
jgi:hypothetical protein